MSHATTLMKVGQGQAEASVAERQTIDRGRAAADVALGADIGRGGHKMIDARGPVGSGTKES